MADEHATVIYDFGVNPTQSEAALKSLQAQLKSFDATMLNSQKLLEQRLTAMTARYDAVINKLLAKTKLSAAEGTRLSRNIERRESLITKTRTDFSRGSADTQNTEATYRRELAEARVTQQQLAARYANDLGRLAIEGVRGMEQNVAARLREASFAADQLLRRTTPALLNARGAEANFRNEQLLTKTAPGVLAARSKAADLANAKLLARTTDEMLAAQVTEAGFQSAALLRKTSPEVLTARVKEAKLQADNLINKTTDESIAARIKDRALQAEALLRRTSATQIASRRALAERRDADNARRFQIGDAAFSNEKTLARISDPSFLGVQARIMGNYAAISGVYSLVQTTITSIIDLDKELRQLQAIAGASEGELKQLEGTVLGLAKGSKFAATEIAQAGTMLAQAGLNAQQIGPALEGVIKLATASGASLQETADIVTSTLTVFDLQATETLNVANLLTAGLNQSKLDIQKLALGIQYSGNIAASANVPLQELVSVLAGLSNAGVRGSTAGTGLRQLILDLSEPSEKLVKILQRIGLTEADINIKTNGLVGVLTNLKNAGFTSADALEAFELRAAAAFSAIANTSDDILQIRQNLTQTTAALDASEIQMKSFANSFARLTNIIQALAYEAFGPLKEALIDVTNLTSYLLEKLSSVSGGLESLRLIFDPVGFAYGKGKAIYDSFDPQVQAQRSLDRTRTDLAEAEGKVSSNAQTIESVTAAIDDLNKHSAALERNRLWGGGDEFKARIMELEQQFGDLGFQVDMSNASVQSLVNSLGALRGSLRDGAPGLYAAQLALLNDQTSQLKDLLKASQDGAPAPAGQVNWWGVPQNPFKKYGDSADVVSRAFVVARGGQSTTTEMSALVSQLEKLDNSPELKELIGVLKTQQSLLIKISASAGLAGQVNSRVFNSQVGASRPLQDLQFRAEGLSKSVTADIADAQRDFAGDPVGFRAKIKELQEVYAERVQGIYDGLDDIEKEIVRFGATPQEAKAAVDFLHIDDALAQVTASLASVFEGSEDEFKRHITKTKELTNRTLKKQADAVEQQIKTLEVQSKLVDSPDGVKDIIKQIREKFAVVLALELKAFDETHPEDAAGRQDLIDKINSEMQTVLARMWEQYRKELDEAVQRPVKLAKLRADSARGEIQKAVLGNRVETAELAAAEEQVKVNQAERTRVQTALTEATRTYGVASEEVFNLTNELAIANERLEKSQEDLDTRSGRLAQNQVTLADAIRQVNREFAESKGVVFGSDGKIDVAATKVQQLANAYRDLQEGVYSAFTELFNFLSEHPKRVSDAFKQMGLSILETLQQVLFKFAALQAVQLLMGTGEQGDYGAIGKGIMAGLNALFQSAPAAAVGEYVQGPITGRDSVLRKVMPGEFILRQSAVSAIGRENLTRVNNLGNTIQSPSIGAPSDVVGGVGGTVNVWIVPQDQVPPPGPKDIVAVVGDNIARRGALKTLIKQVQMGTI